MQESYEGVVPAEPELRVEFAQLKREAMSRTILLGWTIEFELATIPTAVFYGTGLKASYREISDEDLSRRLNAVTGGRCAPALFSPAGLYTLRVLAASFVKDAHSVTAAIPVVLDAIARRIGERPDARLNSYAVIGKRLAVTAIGPIGSHRSTAADPSQAGTAAIRPDWLGRVLACIQDAPGATLIHPRLFAQTAHLAEHRHCSTT